MTTRRFVLEMNTAWPLLDFRHFGAGTLVHLPLEVRVYHPVLRRDDAVTIWPTSFQETFARASGWGFPQSGTGRGASPRQPPERE